MYLLLLLLLFSLTSECMMRRLTGEREGLWGTRLTIGVRALDKSNRPFSVWCSKLHLTAENGIDDANGDSFSVQLKQTCGAALVDIPEFNAAMVVSDRDTAVALSGQEHSLAVAVSDRDTAVAESGQDTAVAVSDRDTAVAVAGQDAHVALATPNRGTASRAVLSEWWKITVWLNQSNSAHRSAFIRIPLSIPMFGGRAAVARDVTVVRVQCVYVWHGRHGTLGIVCDVKMFFCVCESSTFAVVLVCELTVCNVRRCGSLVALMWVGSLSTACIHSTAS
jgi:hypothetical protein